MCCLAVWTEGPAVLHAVCVVRMESGPCCGGTSDGFQNRGGLFPWLLEHWNVTQTAWLETADGAPPFAGWKPKVRCGRLGCPGLQRKLGPRPLSRLWVAAPLHLRLCFLPFWLLRDPSLTQDEPLSRSLAASADMISPEEVPVPGTGDEDVPTMHLTVYGFSACFGCCNKTAQTGRLKNKRLVYCCSSGGREVRDQRAARSGSGEGPHPRPCLHMLGG